MALIRQNIKLESVQFGYGASGDVNSLVLNRSYEVGDDTDLDSAGKPRTQGTLRDAPDVWPQLTVPQRTAFDAIAKRLSAVANAV